MSLGLLGGTVSGWRNWLGRWKESAPTCAVTLCVPAVLGIRRRSALIPGALAGQVGIAPARCAWGMHMLLGLP